MYYDNIFLLVIWENLSFIILVLNGPYISPLKGTKRFHIGHMVKILQTKILIEICSKGYITAIAEVLLP